MDNSPAEHPVYEVIARIDSGWRLKKFDRFDECFDENAVIVGPGHTELARGRKKCAKSYRDFAASGAVLSFSESSHTLHTWETIAVYTFAWKMHYQRHAGAKHESGTDQLVFALTRDRRQLVWRYIYFEPSPQSDSQLQAAASSGPSPRRNG